MNQLEQILTLIGEHVNKKKGTAQRALKALQNDVKKLLDENAEKTVNKDIAYQCSICTKISVQLKDKKYCRDCYQTYVE